MEVDVLSGETLAHFRIERRIGAGGMGIVYRAEDILLRRAVALKVLRTEQLGDERRRARFLREARTVAALVHPNIASVYEVGDAGGTVYIAMELVPGESLREILEGGRVDVVRALRWAIDVARALAKAHEAGVVHRDLKPDNVMITPAGDVKLLDFGVAKALDEPTLGSGDPALDATAQVMTGEGTIVGTPEYMSPEQARGDRIDVRSDLFSFGALLSEMLVGQSPFRRANVVETVVALTRDPAPSIRAARSEVPSAVDAVIARCLAKRPEDRYANGAALLTALRDAVQAGPDSRSPMAETLDAAASVRTVPPRWRLAKARRVAGAGVAALALGAAGLFALHRGDSHPPSPSSADAAPAPARRAQSSAFTERMIGGGKENNSWSYDVSPDGARLVYDDGSGVWTQELPAGPRVQLPVPYTTAQKIVGLNFTSPSTIAYVVSARGSRGSEFWTLGLHDAAPSRLRADPIEVSAAEIARDGKRFVYVTHGGILVGTVDGGAPKRVVTTSAREFIESIAFAPSGDAFVYLELKSGDSRQDLVWMSADGETSSTLDRSESFTGTYGGAGVAFDGADRLLMMRYAEGDHTTLEEVPIGARGAFVGPPHPLFAWHAVTVSQLRAAEGRVVFTESSPNGEVVRFSLSPDLTRVDAPSTVLGSAWILRPLGWLDPTHVAILEEQEGFFHVVSASLDGNVTPYIAGPMTSASLAPNGDVLYWTKGDGGCALMRHRARDGAELPAPQAGTTCDAQVACVASRCVALEEGEDLVSTFRDWDPERGATGPALVRIEAPRVRYALSPDGKLLAATTVQESVTVHDLARGTTQTFASVEPRRVQALTFSPDGAHVLVTGYGGISEESSFKTAILDLDGKSHLLASDPVRWSNGPRFAPDGKSFVVGRKNFGAHLWLLEPDAK